MDIKKWFGQAGSTIASILFVILLACIGAFSLIGMGRTGFDKQVGDTLGLGFELTVKEGGPAIANMFGPSAAVAKESLKNIGPSGTSDWGFLTVNWDDLMNRDGSSTSASNSGNNNNDNANDSNNNGAGGNQQPVGCQQAETPDSRAALDYWNQGQWNNAIAKFKQTNPSQDCLAASMESTFRDFNDKLAQLPAITDPGEFDLLLADLIAINPQVKVLYAAQAMRNAAQWANTAPVDFTRTTDVLKGATVTVMSVHHITSGGEALNTEFDIDYVTLKFDWGSNWMFVLEKISKDDAKALAAADPQLQDNFFLQEGNATVIGSVDAFVPADLPTPKDPRVGYQAPQAAVTNNVQVTQVPDIQNPTSSCTNIADFVSETIADNTVEQANATFTKSWTLKNTGTCTWTTAYTLTLDSGEAMGGGSVNLTQDVAPGATVTVSVNLTAPATAGTYQGFWKLADANGAKFGLDAANKAFWVKIRVQ